MRTFTALITFSSPETKSTYVEGLTYTIRQGNRYLNALAEVWSLERKIQFEHQSHRPLIEGHGPSKDELILRLQNIRGSLKKEVTKLKQDAAYDAQSRHLLLMQLNETHEQADQYISQLEFELANKEVAYQDLTTLLTPEPEIPFPLGDVSIWEKTKTAWSRLWQ